MTIALPLAEAPDDTMPLLPPIGFGVANADWREGMKPDEPGPAGEGGDECMPRPGSICRLRFGLVSMKAVEVVSLRMLRMCR
mmetsp:Transcript_68925/g.180658  ORF Transcript_68925/g.180658 Transcript_68925/m.180658 type:complete len:82 (-) Transcript_68925:70-315(-)